VEIAVVEIAVMEIPVMEIAIMEIAYPFMEWSLLARAISPKPCDG
jgi:hypothetical protein